MQVAHENGNITHAIIGGGEAIDFGISNDPAFFHILSSTLYSNPKLAVIRETICNAWDAHIDSGMDQPIVIELTSQELVIRDFGHGIPDDMIGPVYGVYGGSTKKNDKKQTGGFGLGCKAPFSYTDTFTVSSWNQGTKTVYVMSKSSGEAMGKPSIRPIVSIPTDQTGLEVRVPIQAVDRSVLESHIKEVVFNGGIKATLNTVPLETLPYPTEHGFIVGTKPTTGYNSSRRNVFVKYGNVIYPIPTHAEYDNYAHEVTTYLQNSAFNQYGRDSFVILEAESDSISVMPSREGLSMQDKTIQTIKQLLGNFIKHVNVARSMTMLELGKQIDHFTANKEYRYLFGTSDLKRSMISARLNENHITSLEQLTRCFFLGGLRNIDLKRESVICTERLVAEKLIDGRLVRQQQKLQKAGKSGLVWINQHMLQPLLKRMPEGMLRSRLSRKDESTITTGYSYYSIKSNISENTLLGYFAKLVVISYARDGYEHRLNHQPLFKAYGKISHLLYHAPRSEAKVKQAIEYFKRFGFTVVDLTIVHEGERADVIEPVKRYTPVAKKKEPGIPIASAALNDDRTNADRYFEDDVSRITAPEWVVVFNNNKENREHYSTNSRNTFCFSEANNAFITRDILSLFGSVGGIVRTKKQEEAYIAKGAITLNKFIEKTIKEALVSDTELIAYYAVNFHQAVEGMANLLRCVNHDPELQKELGIVHTPVSERVMTLVRIINSVDTGYLYRNLHVEIRELISKIPADPIYQALAAKYKTALTGTLRLYNLDEAYEAIKNNDKTCADEAREILLHFLK